MKEMDYCFTNGLKILKVLSKASETKFFWGKLSISAYTVQSTLDKRHDKKIISNVLNSKVLWFLKLTIYYYLVRGAIKFLLSLSRRFKAFSIIFCTEL